MVKINSTNLLLLLAFVFFMLFVFFTYFVKLDLLKSLDFNLIVRIQDKVPTGLYPLLITASNSASFYLVTPVLLIGLIALYRLRGVVVFGIYGASHVLEYFLKTVLHQPGPPFLFHKAYETLSFIIDYVVPGSSYPSGHSFRAVFLSIIIAYIILTSKKGSVAVRYGALILLPIYSILVILSKVTFGEHWPSDVMGGAMLGASFGLVVVYFFLSNLSKRRIFTPL